MSEAGQAKKIFIEALECHSSEDLIGLLDRECAGDSEIRKRVEELLRAYGQAGKFLCFPAADDADPDDLSEGVGSVIGPYNLLQQLGEGGMGIVFLAEQNEPVRRIVALKIIKPGMDSQQVIARFSAERQALALMDHPNIARIIDAGTTNTGRPFFVMDLVRGVPITDFCDAKQLRIGERLALFVVVCQAVQHAHHKGIIHRDLKPSNILVTESDGVPTPKIIDFGVAKATCQSLPDRTMYTGYGQVIGTFEYMSPEQARFNQPDIDTRSDIYSLGVLLYELLTGTTPLERQRLRVSAFDEALQIVRDEVPAKPSSRLTASGTPPFVAENRRTETRRLKNELRGELDWVVMRCLEKDRNRRYETASGLAADIQRYLRDEPVQACRPSAAYRLRKAVRRNKVAFSALAGVLAALVLGLCVSTWALVRESAARQQAESARTASDAAASKSRQVATFLKKMLEGVQPSVALGRDSSMLREILDSTAQQVGVGLKDQPEVEAELRDTLGLTYFRLGEFSKAEAMHRDALRLRETVFGQENVLVANSLSELARVLINVSDSARLPEAELLLRRALAIRRKLFGDKHPDVAFSLYLLASIIQRQGRLSEAEAAHREALAMRKELFGEAHQDVAASLNNLALLLADQGRYGEAEGALREALAIQRQLMDEDHPDIADSYLNLAKVLGSQRKLAEAESAAREALRIRRKVFGSDHTSVAIALSRLAGTLARQGKLEGAQSVYRDVIEMQKRVAGVEHPSVAAALETFAEMLDMHGDSTKAETIYREALSMRRKLLGDVHPDVLVAIDRLATLLRKQGELAEAEALFRERLNGERGRSPQDSLKVRNAVFSLALTLLYAEKFAEAEAMARELLTLQERESRPADPWSRAHAEIILGISLLGQNQYPDAQPLLIAGYEGMKQHGQQVLPYRSVRLQEALSRIVQIHETNGDTEEAAKWKTRLSELEKGKHSD